MKHTIIAAATIAAVGTAASAGGIDRSGQGLGALFEKGRYFELSLGHVAPKVTGMDIPPPGAPFPARSIGDVTKDYTQFSLSYKQDINDQLSFAVNIDQPFGAAVQYDAGSFMLGNTMARADATAMTALLRYKFNESFSVHGGIRATRASAAVDLRGAAYGGLNGYSVRLDSDIAPGYVIGVAYEKPEIALRIALTYNSSTKHKFDSVEYGLPGALAALNGLTRQTIVKTPQTVNLDFQSGVAKDTLVFGQIRWADWSSFKLQPPGFVQVPGQADGLITLKDSTTYTLGVGRRFNDSWSGAFSVSYEDKDNPLVSPLAPTNGRIGATLAAVYTTGNMKITTGINYTKLGAAQPETGTPDVARANSKGHAIGVGVKVGWSF